jgi:DNA-binding response OmpR family regulator
LVLDGARLRPGSAPAIPPYSPRAAVTKVGGVVIDPRTALLVEDNPAILSGLSEMLRSAGLQVVSCRDFQEARDYLQGHTPHVLVTDVRLGAYNGLHLVLLARKLAPDLPVIVYSAHDDPELRREAESFGAVYLEKDRLLTDLLPRVLTIA